MDLNFESQPSVGVSLPGSSSEEEDMLVGVGDGGPAETRLKMFMLVHGSVVVMEVTRVVR